MKLSKGKIGEQKNENIIVIICMIAIVILTFVIFGWSSIKSWLSAPLIWKGQNSLETHYLGTLPNKNSNEDYNIFLAIKPMKKLMSTTLHLILKALNLIIQVIPILIFPHME